MTRMSPVADPMVATVQFRHCQRRLTPYLCVVRFLASTRGNQTPSKQGAGRQVSDTLEVMINDRMQGALQPDGHWL